VIVLDAVGDRVVVSVVDGVAVTVGVED